MDLFFDNPVVALNNGIVRALSARNLGEAQRQLDRLYAQAPNHADLAAFDRLLAALGHLNRPIDDPRQELAFLLDITPAAKRLLGWEARDLLAPLWRQLADALRSRTFSIDEPNLHRRAGSAQNAAGRSPGPVPLFEEECVRACPYCSKIPGYQPPLVPWHPAGAALAGLSFTGLTQYPSCKLRTFIGE